MKRRYLQLAGGALAGLAGLAAALVAGSAHGAPSEPLFHSSGSLIFGFEPVGSTSEPLTETISNTGGGTLSITGAEIQASGKRNFSIVSDGCEGAQLTSQQSCEITVVFHPAVATTILGSIAITDTREACGKSYVSLAGSGTATTPTPTPAPTASAADCLVTETLPARTLPVRTMTVYRPLPTPVRVRTVHAPPPPPCASKRVLRIPLKGGKLGPIVETKIYLDGQLLGVEHGRSLKWATVSLRGKPRARWRVVLLSITKSGKRLHFSHYYVTCIPGH